MFGGMSATAHPCPLPPLCWWGLLSSLERAVGRCWVLGERKRCCPMPEDRASLLSQEHLPAGRGGPVAEIMAQVAVKGDRGTNPAGSCGLSTVLTS